MMGSKKYKSGPYCWYSSNGIIHEHGEQLKQEIGIEDMCDNMNEHYLDTTHRCRPPQPNNEGWEDRFNNKWKNLRGKNITLNWVILNKEVKQFIAQELANQRQKLIERVEVVFDNFRSSNQKNNQGKRRFGVAEFKINARHIHAELLQAIKEK